MFEVREFILLFIRSDFQENATQTYLSLISINHFILIIR